MSCPRHVRTCELLLQGRLSSEERADLQAHAGQCAECADASRVIDVLREAASSFAVPEPHPSYWVFFGERMKERLGSPRGMGVPSFTSWTARLSLGLAVCALIVAFALIMRPAGTRSASPPGADGGSVPAEGDLIRRLGEAPLAAVSEALGGGTTEESAATTEELAALENVLQEGDAGSGAGVSPYELFLDLRAEERIRLLKELHDEIG